MGKSKITIKVESGVYNILDKQYNRFITHSLIKMDEKTIDRWYTYESIINELIKMDAINCFNEIKYRLTGGEDPNDIIIDILSSNKNIGGDLKHYLLVLEDYRNEDFFKRFY